MNYILYAVLLLISMTAMGQQPGKLKIRVSLAGSKVTDTLYFSFQDQINFQSSSKPLIVGKNIGNYYDFDITTIDTCGYFTIMKKRTFTDNGGGSDNLTSVVNPQFWRSGDSITMNIDYHETMAGMYNKLSVSGKGAEKYNLLKAIDSLRFNDTISVSFPAEDWARLFQNPSSNVIDRTTKLLESRKGYLDQFSYDVLKANATWINAKYIFYRISKTYNELKTDQHKQEFMNFYEEHIDQFYKTDIPVEALINSNYLLFTFEGFRSESFLKNGKEDFGWIYKKVIEETQGVLRDRILALCFSKLKKPQNLDLFIKLALGVVGDAHSRDVIAKFAKHTAGSKFEGYRLQDVHGNSLELDSLMKNKVVVMDFWTYGCPPCRLLFENSIKPNEAFFSDDDSILFISVCLDRKKERWIKGIDQGFYTSAHATHLTTGEIGSKHPLLIENSIKATPTILLINREGKMAQYNSEDLYNEDGLKKAILRLK